MNALEQYEWQRNDKVALQHRHDELYGSEENGGG
jgi:hypothetical protein